MKKVLFILLIFLIFSLLIFFYFVFFNFEKMELEEEDLIEFITSRNKELVIVTNDTLIYNSMGEEIGKIYKDEVIELEVLDVISTDTKYLKLVNRDYYISYLDVEEYFGELIVNNDYKSLIPFNESIIADRVIFYRDNIPFLEVKDNINLPIIKKDEIYYYVEYNSELVSIRRDSVDVIESINTSLEVAKSIPVLNYHFFYDVGENDCNQIICHRTDRFEQDLIYMKDNGYYAVTMDELYSFLSGEINLPLKSIAITIDDGWKAFKGILLLEKYQFNHTLFTVTSFFDEGGFPTGNYLELHSHTDDLHDPYVCPGYGLQGSAMYCYDYESIYNDLLLSQEKLGGSDVFCYPFYEVSDLSITVLKDLGFKMAFVGGNKNAYPGVDMYRVPRHIIWTDTNIKNILN